MKQHYRNFICPLDSFGSCHNFLWINEETFQFLLKMKNGNCHPSNVNVGDNLFILVHIHTNTFLICCSFFHFLLTELLRSSIYDIIQHTQTKYTNTNFTYYSSFVILH